MNEGKRAGILSWGISLLVHALALVAAASAGLFLLVQPPSEPNIVDVALLPGSGQQQGESGPAGGEQTAPTSAGGAAGMAMPDLSDVPEIRETYTRDSEKQKAYRQAHHVSADGTVVQPATQPAAGSKGSAGSTGSATDRPTGGNGGRAENGAGNSAGNGGDAGAGGNASAPPVPTERITAVCTYRPDPVYPESLRAQGAEGHVQVRIMVSADNSIEGVEILSSSGYPAMDQAALRAAWGCRFQMNGYLGRYTTTYRFALTGGDDW
jgi:protein TonB